MKDFATPVTLKEFFTLLCLYSGNVGKEKEPGCQLMLITGDLGTIAYSLGPWLMTDTVSVCKLEIRLLQPSRVLTPAPFLPAFPHLALPPEPQLFKVHGDSLF